MQEAENLLAGEEYHDPSAPVIDRSADLGLLGARKEMIRREKVLDFTPAGYCISTIQTSLWVIRRE